MKNASLVPAGVLVLGGLAWFLTRGEGRRDVSGVTTPSPGHGAQEGAPAAPTAGMLEEPYVPPGLPQREAERGALPADPEAQARVHGAEPLAGVEAPERDPDALIARDQAIALDAARSLEDRVRAIRNLNSYKIMDDLEGRTPDVLAEAFWILEYADDPDVREDLLQGLQDLDDPAVVAPLARVLREDLEPQVREAAAEVLREHRTDPAAAAALRQAAEDDADERVRVAASRGR